MWDSKIRKPLTNDLLYEFFELFWCMRRILVYPVQCYIWNYDASIWFFYITRHLFGQNSHVTGKSKRCISREKMSYPTSSEVSGFFKLWYENVKMSIHGQRKNTWLKFKRFHLSLLTNLSIHRRIYGGKTEKFTKRSNV